MDDEEECGGSPQTDLIDNLELNSAVEYKLHPTGEIIQTRENR